MRKLNKSILRYLNKNRIVSFVLAFTLAGVITLLLTKAASAPSSSSEAESGSTQLPAMINSDPAASGGKYVQFGTTQPPPPPPYPTSKGVYIADFFASPDASLLADTNVDGFFQAYKWSDIEPSPNNPQYNSKAAPLDSDFSAIADAHKTVALGIDTGSRTPTWAEPQSHNFIICSHDCSIGNPPNCHQITVPIPWDSTYQSNLNQLIQALVSHLKNTQTTGSVKVPEYDLITQIKLTGITEDTEETRMPAEGIHNCQLGGGTLTQTTNAPADWQQLGYTRSKAEAAWKTLAGYWATAFPDKTLAMPIIGAGGFPNIDDSGTIQSGNDTTTTQDLYSYAATTWNKRFLMMHNSLHEGSSETNSTTSYNLGSSIGFQLYGLEYGVGQTPPSSTVFQQAIDNGLSYHMQYLEVFKNDPLLSGYDGLLAYFRAKVLP